MAVIPSNFGPTTLPNTTPSTLNNNYEQNVALGQIFNANSSTNTQVLNAQQNALLPKSTTASGVFASYIQNGTTATCGPIEGVIQQEINPLAANLQSTTSAASNVSSGSTGQLLQDSPGGNTGNLNSTNPNTTNTIDKRIRLRPMDPSLNDSVYGGTSGIMGPLYTSNGLIWPYTPTVTLQGSADYTPLSPVHSIQDFYSYQRTPSITYSISGMFTAQNTTEAAYSLAAIHFCRAMTKSHFGQNDTNAGLPPPMLLLSGYGTYMFNDLPVLFKDYNIGYDSAMDTVRVVLPGGDAWVPSAFTISVTVIVQQTPTNVRTKFNLSDFQSGALLAQKGWN